MAGGIRYVVRSVLPTYGYGSALQVLTHCWQEWLSPVYVYAWVIAVASVVMWRILPHVPRHRRCMRCMWTSPDAPFRFCLQARAVRSASSTRFAATPAATPASTWPRPASASAIVSRAASVPRDRRWTLTTGVRRSAAVRVCTTIRSIGLVIGATRAPAHPYSSGELATTDGYRDDQTHRRTDIDQTHKLVSVT